MGIDRTILFKTATSDRLERSIKSVPGGEDATWPAAARYVAGRNREEALRTAGDLLAAGHGVSVDLFGELVADPAEADRIAEEYRSLASALPPPPADAWLAVDLSHLAVDVDINGMADRLASIASTLPEGRRVQVGTEDAGRTDAVLACVHAVADRGLADRLGATVQANLRRSEADLDGLVAAGVHIRLVMGAYVETQGAQPYGEATDIAYLRLAFRLAGQGATWSMATHDGRLREALLLALGPVPVEHLLGLRPEVPSDLRSRPVPTGSTSLMARTGSPTGCAASPSHEAPDPRSGSRSACGAGTSRNRHSCGTTALRRIPAAS